MNWIQSLTKAIDHIEAHITDEISIDEIANAVYTSSSHFQFIFHVVMGITIGEYIRNRRLSLAAQDLIQSKSRIKDVAMRYQYDTQESFSKAFTRFHGVPPSKVRREQVKMYYPLTINISIRGGFDMSREIIEGFWLIDWREVDEKKENELTPEERYKIVVNWALKARGKNPNVFDALSEWILDDSNWSDDKLAENEEILMQGVFARFKEQNARLRTYLKDLEPSGVVNAAVFTALDRFDRELSGKIHDDHLRETIEKVFADFTVMKERKVREYVAGGKTGPAGTDTVDVFGFINFLKDCDAGVQWALFMPDVVKGQQQGFKVDSFEYRKMPAMRFIGRESCEGDGMDTDEGLKQHFDVLDAMPEYKSGFDYDVMLMHHYGRGVDVEPWHGFWGRFMKADAPVPEGYLHFDFVPQIDYKAGLPFCSQFAYATFSGDTEAIHRQEGYDSDAMYDVTRNIILGQGANIPYPEKYWIAEVFPEGWEKGSYAYMFSAIR